MAETLASLREIIAARDAQIAQLISEQGVGATVSIYEGGYGNISLRTVARNDGEAINNFIDKEPVLRAIGCTAQLMPDVDGCKVVAIIPEGFEFGDDKRNQPSILD